MKPTIANGRAQRAHATRALVRYLTIVLTSIIRAIHVAMMHIINGIILPSQIFAATSPRSLNPFHALHLQRACPSRRSLNFKKAPFLVRRRRGNGTLLALTIKCSVWYPNSDRSQRKNLGVAGGAETIPLMPLMSGTSSTAARNVTQRTIS